MAAKKRSKSKASNKSFIVTLAVVALIAYFTISLISLQVQISEKKQEVETAQNTLSQLQEQNDELKALDEIEDEESYMERVARDVLGYVFPGESVYYDVSTGN